MSFRSACPGDVHPNGLPSVAQASQPLSFHSTTSMPANGLAHIPSTDHCPPSTVHRVPIYVDRLRVHRSRTEPARTFGEQFGHRWCHLWSDDLDALHAMAAALGIRREWFQDRPGFPHYDLPPFRRERALILGAVEHSLKTWLRERRHPAQDVRVSSLSAPSSLLP